MDKIAAIVVTYNRKALLRENIEALINQNVDELDILIIDNASTDGTEEMVSQIVSDKIIYKNTGSNLGGAGGFSYGVKIACEMGYRYGWIMDDDSIPQKDSLSVLLRFAEKNEFSFLASTVYWTDMTLFPMNQPVMEMLDNETIKIIQTTPAIPIKMSSFVGCFIDMEVVKKAGLPIAEFFIYGDDAEYTQRLRFYASAYWLLNSEIIHKTSSNIGADIGKVSAERVDRFFYQARNSVYIAKKKHTTNATIELMRSSMRKLWHIFKYAEDKKLKRIAVLVRGWWAGMFFNPEIQYPNLYDVENSVERKI